MYRETRTRTFPVNNYVPKKSNDNFNLKYEEIIQDFDYYFQKCYVTNFDIIHHECRGDELNFSKKFYEKINDSDIEKNLNENNQVNFISAAIKSERDDLYFGKESLIKHFKREFLIKNLEEKGIFLSAMKKKFYLKKTDNCKSLKF